MSVMIVRRAVAMVLGAAIGLTLAGMTLTGFSMADDVLALPDTGNMVDYRGQSGATGVFEVTGALDGRIFGTGVYTDDSDVATAAVHAGVIAPGETKDLTIEILAGKSSYRGSSSHGVVSGDFGSWRGSYEFLDTPEVQTNGKVLPDPGNLKGYRDQLGRTLSFALTGSTDGAVYGDGVYTDDSKLSTAAVHAGLLAPGERGNVAVVILPGQQHYSGATRNNIYARDFGAWDGSFRFAAAAPPPDATPNPGDMQAYRGRNGQVFQFAVTGDAEGAVFGDGIYTDDTRIAAAAVHAGVLANGQAGVVSIKVLPGQDAYVGASRNGIVSLGYGHWDGSYQFVGGK